MLHSNFQLHLIQNKLSFATFERLLLRFAADGDSLLFLNDSVFVLFLTEFQSEKFHQLINKISVYAINEHLQARNITRFTDKLKTINYADFVVKSQNCSKIVSW